MTEKMMENQPDTSKEVSEFMDSKKVTRKSWDEMKKMWHIAGPAILTGLAQFLIGSVTSAFIGRVGIVELAALSIVQNVIEGFSYGVMVSIIYMSLFIGFSNALHLLVLNHLLKASQAEERIRTWGGPAKLEPAQILPKMVMQLSNFSSICMWVFLITATRLWRGVTWRRQKWKANGFSLRRWQVRIVTTCW